MRDRIGNRLKVSTIIWLLAAGVCLLTFMTSPLTLQAAEVQTDSKATTVADDTKKELSKSQEEARRVLIIKIMLIPGAILFIATLIVMNRIIVYFDKIGVTPQAEEKTEQVQEPDNSEASTEETESASEDSMEGAEAVSEDSKMEGAEAVSEDTNFSS